MEIIIKFLKKAAIITKISSPINVVFEEKKLKLEPKQVLTKRRRRKKNTKISSLINGDSWRL